jgi:uncharacterized secreted protein with C-terminal beta-propeller domain
MRKRKRRFFSNQNFLRWMCGNPKKITQDNRMSLHLEQLEQRMLMNADNNPEPLAEVDDDIQIRPIAIAAGITPAMPVVIDTFVDDGLKFSSNISLMGLPPVPQEGIESVEELRTWMMNAIDMRYGHLFGKSYSFRSDRIFRDFNYNLSDSTTVAMSVNNVASAFSSFSGTNIQVEGVDEADLLETDGKYLYLVTGDELVIVDASDGENLSIVSRVHLEDRPVGIYLSEDRLTLISSNEPLDEPFAGLLRFDLGFVNSGRWNATTTVTVLDLTDRAAPSQVQKTELRGNLISSRMVDGQLRLVLSHSPLRLPGPKINIVFNEDTGQTESIYETRDETMSRVLDDMVNSVLSTYRTFSVASEVLDQSWLIQPNELNGFWSGKTIIATFDVLGDVAGPTDVETLRTGAAAEVYSTQNSLYIFGAVGFSSRETSIWKYDFNSNDHSINLSARGKVEGTLLNQFSADEQHGFLRVVTKGKSWGHSASLFVLEQVGNQLKVVGSVDDLAPGETLYSVRFLGERAFVVTFRKVDPLFALDLSDPTNPMVAGELKIPGYTDYMQPLGENHLLGIGRGASESRGLFQEMQISIFDVSNLNDPQLAHRFSLDGGRSTASITTGGRWTQGDGDHHAVSYFPSEQILAIPIHSENNFGGLFAGFDNTPIFDQGEGGLQVFSIDTEIGIESLAIIEHDTPILRSLRIGETLLAFSAGEITSHDITGSIDQLDSLQLHVGSETGWVELTAYNSLPTSTDFQAIGSAMLAHRAGDSSTDSAIEEVPDSIQPIAERVLFSAFPSDRFNDARSKAAVDDFIFSANAEESLFALDSTLAKELVSTLIGNQ